MKPRTFLILIAILLVLAGSGWWMHRADEDPTPGGGMGVLLFRDIPLNDIALLRLSGSGGSVTIKKGESGWYVPERWNYPADFARIADFLRKLKEVKIGREFPASRETIGRLSLRDPSDNSASKEEKAILLALEKTGGIKIESLLIGKHRQTEVQTGTPSGRYVMKEGGSVVYLADWQIAGPSEEPSYWLDRDLLNVKADEIESVTCLSGKDNVTRYAFARPERGKPFLPKEPRDSGTVNTSELDRLTGTLSNLRLSDVAGPYEAGVTADGFDASLKIEYRLFNGLVYTIYPGGECGGENCKMRIEVDFQKPPAPQKENQEGQKEAVKSPEELQREAKEANARLSPWVYLVPSWQHAAFVTKAEELFEKEKKDDQKGGQRTPTKGGT